MLITFGLMFGCVGTKPIPESEKGPIEYVIEVQGFEKNYIYDTIRMWIAENFKSAKAVIEYTNKENGTIIGNGSMEYLCQGMECFAIAYNGLTSSAFFTMRVDIKDNKIRLIFMNLRYSIGGHPYQPFSEKARIAHKPKFLAFGDEIKLYIEQDNKEKDW